MRFVFRADTPDEAKSILGGWLAWASRSRLPEFTKVAQTVRRKQELIWNTLEAGLSNAVLEATNNTFRLMTRRAYGFHSAEALIAMSDPRRALPTPARTGLTSRVSHT